MAHYTRNTGKGWSAGDKRQLQVLAGDNTPTRVIGLKLGRTVPSVRTMASNLDVSLKPPNRSPRGRAR